MTTSDPRRRTWTHRVLDTCSSSLLAFLLLAAPRNVIARGLSGLRDLEGWSAIPRLYNGLASGALTFFLP